MAVGKGFWQDRPTCPDCSEPEEGRKVSAVGTTGLGAGKGSVPSGDLECSRQRKGSGCWRGKTPCPLHQPSDCRWGAPATQGPAASWGCSLCRCGSVKCTSSAPPSAAASGSPLGSLPPTRVCDQSQLHVSCPGLRASLFSPSHWVKARMWPPSPCFWPPADSEMRAWVSAPGVGHSSPQIPYLFQQSSTCLGKAAVGWVERPIQKGVGHCFSGEHWEAPAAGFLALRPLLASPQHSLSLSLSPATSSLCLHHSPLLADIPTTLEFSWFLKEV